MTNELTDLSPAFKEEVEKELDRLRATPVGRRITALETLLGDVGGGALAAIDRELRDRVRDVGASIARPGTGVSDAKLNAVRQYMQTHGEARQVDVTNDLEENSGSISLALRALASQGVVEDTGKVDRKAKVWRYIGPKTDGDKRATVVDVGEGVREGRRITK